MIPMSLPVASGIKPRRFTALVLAIVLLSAAYIADRVAYWTRNWNAQDAFSTATGPVSIQVGQAGFNLPAEYIAMRRQRVAAQAGGSSVSALKLSMTWPDLEPAHSGSLAHYGLHDQVLVVELEFNPGRESMRARLDPFYRRLARGGELNGPNGLKILRLSARGAAGRDLIAYDPEKPGGFIARCQKTGSGRDATCHRAIVLSSGLELRYRFDQYLLREWRHIDSAIIEKVTAFRSG
ncbi:hypothetical protein ABVF61_01830 [Roseibium sp. HPY-6]|uniref:hypothetical protein n=1 Tax=Roseibium sp. HPY-6 TaxID=3229852 RepID=UPI00338FF5DE